MNTKNCLSDQERSLRNISIVSFVVVELTEYLDTHPDDRDALSYFDYYNRMLNQMAAEYAVQYEPLNIATARFVRQGVEMGHGASSLGKELLLMWNYEKRLQFPIHIKEPNAKLAQFIISQYGGPDGELGASMRYLSQAVLPCPTGRWPDF